MNADGYVIIGTKIDNNGFKKGIKELEGGTDGVEEKIVDTLKDSAQKSTKEISKIGSGLKNSVTSITKKLTTNIPILFGKLIKTLGTTIKVIASTLGTVITGLIKGIGKIVLMSAGISLSLGAIGVVAAIIVKAFQKIADENKQFLTDVKYIGFAFSTVLQPAVDALANAVAKLLQLLFKVLQYIGFVIQAWTGKNIFKNAGADEFAKSMAKASKSSKETAKNAKEIKNQLAGFDEMNVLSDTSGGGSPSDTSGSSIGTPSFDLSKMQGEVPKWLQWIADNGDAILALVSGIVAAIIALKLGLTDIQSLGIGIAVAGLVLLIQDVIKFIKEPTWEGFLNILRDIALVVLGIAIAVGAWPVAIGAAIALVVVLIIKYWDKIKEFLQKGIDWLKDKSDWIHQTFGDSIGGIYDAIVEVFQNILDWAGRMINRIKANFDEIVNFIKNVFAGNWKGAWQNVKNIFKNIWDGMKDTASTAFNAILNVAKSIGSSVGNVIASTFKNVVNSVLKAIENILNSPIRTINSLIGVINKIPGINLGKLSTFSLPRLAKGTIVNAPGKGVLTPSGTALYGEAGPEAYLPLSDTQLLEQLGSTIGKYININATIPVQIGNRVVAREIKRINAENDFAFNR